MATQTLEQSAHVEIGVRALALLQEAFITLSRFEIDRAAYAVTCGETPPSLLLPADWYERAGDALLGETI